MTDHWTLCPEFILGPMTSHRTLHPGHCARALLGPITNHRTLHPGHCAPSFTWANGRPPRTWTSDIGLKFTRANDQTGHQINASDEKELQRYTHTDRL
jgi:hypothetical protein